MSKCINVVIGQPIVETWAMFCSEKEEWDKIVKDVHFTNERFLPKLMVDTGIVKSISEVRRNKPELMIYLDRLDFLEIKWGKNWLFILVGR